MPGKTRNRSPLATLLGQQPVVAGDSQSSGARDYSQIIEEVRAAAEKRDPQYGEVARATEFIDIENPTLAQKALLVATARKKYGRKTKNMSDDEILSDVDDIDTAATLRGTNIVLYDSRQMNQYSPSAAAVFFAHEVGHRIRSQRGIPGRSEKDADKIAAEIFGPQKVVDAFRELAIIAPLSNDIAFQKKGSPHGYRTDYQRALDIQKEFPNEKIDLSHFPLPTNNHRKPKTTPQQFGPFVVLKPESTPGL